LEAAVERRIQENLTVQDVLLNVVTQLAETRDSETGNHILRIRSYIGTLARGMQRLSDQALELDNRTIDFIVKASPLHDIGKIGISDTILNKPGELTTDEFNIMKSHCRIGAQTIRTAIEKVHRDNGPRLGVKKPDSLTILEYAETIALTHHERWDGTGYPTGLRGAEIPLMGRLMAVADVFDTLTSSRNYKSAWSFKKSVDYIISQRGIQFDPIVVDVFAAEMSLFESVMIRLADTKK
jgi:putative two-component system response regulator